MQMLKGRRNYAKERKDSAANRRAGKKRVANAYERLRFELGLPQESDEITDKEAIMLREHLLRVRKSYQKQ